MKQQYVKCEAILCVCVCVFVSIDVLALFKKPFGRFHLQKVEAARKAELDQEVNLSLCVVFYYY